jgi:hypothetical protein
LRPLDRPRSARTADALVLAALILGVAAFYSHYALRVGTFQDDEDMYIRLARYIAAHFPGALWEPIYHRGLQRLDPLVMAVPFSFTRGPGAFEIDHIIQCVLFASTALPVFLLARCARLSRPLSYLAALLAVVLPWGVVSTSFLSESLAYPAFAWVLYTVWQAACDPSLKHEVLALAALVIAAFSRTALLGMLPLLPLSVLWQTWSCELSGGGRARVRGLPHRLWNGHRLVSVVLAVGITVYLAQLLGILPAGLSNTLTGSYGLPQLGALGPLYARDRYFLSRMVAGTGYIPFAFALGWIAVALVRRRDGNRHGLAVVCLLGLICELFSLLPAGPDERYVVYGAIPIILGFAAAIQERVRLPVVGGAIVTVLLIESVTWPPLANLYDFFTYPAAIFYSRVLGNHLDSLPLIHMTAGHVIDGGIVLAAIVWVLLGSRGRLARPAAALFAIAVLGLGATQTVYALRKYTAGAAHGQSPDARSWVDRQVPSGEHVATLSISLGQSFDFLPIWREVEFWNTSIEATAFFGYPGFAPLSLGISPLTLSVAPQSGLLSATEVGRPRPIPRFMLVPRLGTLPIGLDTEHVSEDPALLLNLLRLHQPARVLWLLRGTSDEGFMAPHKPAEIQLYGPASSGATCVGLSLVGPPNYPNGWPYAILEGGHTAARGRLEAQHQVRLAIPLQQRPSGLARRLVIRVDGAVPYPNGETVSARIEDVTLARCGGG